MPLVTTLDRLHLSVRRNRWLRYFTVFCRVALAAGFLPSGWVKVSGERFTSLDLNHPMKQYLDAFFDTGYYYPFVGVLQLTAAVLLLIPRTALLGALLYFPIILNICVLSFSVRFDGSLLTSPLMVLANLYLLCWDYHKLKYLLPTPAGGGADAEIRALPRSNRFPFLFFAGVAATVVLVGAVVINLYTIKPRVTPEQCLEQCVPGPDEAACRAFCACIYERGEPLGECMEGWWER